MPCDSVAMQQQLTGTLVHATARADPLSTSDGLIQIHGHKEIYNFDFSFGLQTRIQAAEVSGQ